MLLIFILGILLTIAGIILSEKTRCDDGAIAIVAIGIIICLIFIIIAPIHYSVSLDTIGRLKGFYTTQYAYNQAIIEATNKAIIIQHLPKDYRLQFNKEELKDILKSIGEKEIVNLDNFKQSTTISGFIQEYRNKIEEYNKDLNTLRIYKNNWFWGFITPLIPEELEEITYIP